jgi:metallophosphoesterase (TIGR03767 family)
LRGVVEQSRGCVPAYLLSALATVLSAVLLAADTAWSRSDTKRKTTVEQRVIGGGTGFRMLGLGPGEPYVVRGEGIGSPRPGRERRRRSLIYFGQLTDFQLADEESPARVEALDRIGGPFTAAWRPMEALGPHTVEAAVRQMNWFVKRSPVRQGNRPRARMKLAVVTGDSADNQQRNETEWVVRLLEGGRLDPNSGSASLADYTHCPAGTPGPAEAARYTGVQDYDDYSSPDPDYYDPDRPIGPTFSSWPAYLGLMDRAQVPFRARGLDVPTFVAFGNHDGLWQGNLSANSVLEARLLGCTKMINSNTIVSVPPDPNRQFVSKPQYKALHDTPQTRNAHGFGLVDPQVEAASAGSAGYYDWRPARGLRFIMLDTVAEGGSLGGDGNVDDPQFSWLEDELRTATSRNELVVIFSHHAIASLTASTPDEAARCTGRDDGHGHDETPGCDIDPRTSTPIHLGADLTALLHRYPHAIAWVAGHSHVNVVEPFRAPDGSSGFWSIRTASEIDWPQQNRLLELMDNRDGTLSIFGTILDHAAPTAAPPSGTPARNLAITDLASISRVFANNDTQTGQPIGEGALSSRNVELLVDDPRRRPPGERPDRDD